jgi:single-stranded-DNA-specific exonuclease
MQNKWEFYEEYPHEVVDELRRQLLAPELVIQLLLNRGLRTIDEVQAFLNPSTANLHDPFLMKDMESAVTRVIQALRNKEKIYLFGDYDVDGITAVSMLYLFLKDLGGDVHYYIPDRQIEGYGLSAGGVERIAEAGGLLIISVDCGINSIDEAKLARDLGVDIIISDHHEQGDALPDATAVLDPKREDCEYPFKDLAGVGVAYKLAQGITQHMGMDTHYLENYIDLVAIGSAADIVPLIDENRIFVKEGLQKINSNLEIGIQALIDVAGLRLGKMDVGQIIFGMAPRLNAVGRLGDAMRAVELLVTRNASQAITLARELELENRRRKEIDNVTLDEAMAEIDSTYDPETDRAIVLMREKWHPGVIGIVASRIIEKFYRPTIMITIENGVGKGSARSIPGFDIYGALKQCEDLLLQFGGHKYAAGLSIKAESFTEFRRRFNEIARGMLTEDNLVPKITIDAAITLNDITPQIVKFLRHFAPFGPKNTRPLFVSYAVEVVGTPRIVGSNHLKFRVRQGGEVFDCIGFNMGDFLPRLELGSRMVDMVYVIEENEWNNRKTIQLRIKDIK